MADLLEVLYEDFKSLKIGPFPAIKRAEGEYHYENPGYRSIWYEPNKATGWQNIHCWSIKERNGSHEMEQEVDEASMPLSGQGTLPMLVAGDLQWKDYTIEVSIWPLSTRNRCGVCFHYLDSRHFYLFCITEGKSAFLYKKDEESLNVLARMAFLYNCDEVYKLKVAIQGDRIVCSINGTVMISVEERSFSNGKIAITASTPVRFLLVQAWMDKTEYERLTALKNAHKAKVSLKAMTYPEPRLYRVIDLKNFGAARSIRYGDLTGNGQKDLLFVQNLPVLNTGDECMISCITAVDLNGNVLWQTGEPDLSNGMITADVAVQICDIDGDGFNEVIYCKDFKIIIADGKTGKIKCQVPTPRAVKVENKVIYENCILDRIIGDSIRICNFSGTARPSDILIKDRYNNLWVYDCSLELKWQMTLNTGHFPVNFDINGDGRDELVASHSLLDCHGQLIWRLPNMIDHVDEIAIGKFNPEFDKYIIAMAAGEDGFLLVDQDGNILLQDFIGHAQRVSVADYRQDIPGLEYCVVTYWRNTGIIIYYDCKGNRLYSVETGANGNVITPVNWTGDGRQLILYSASTIYGGLFDGYGDKVVSFPDDGHPELCTDVLDLIGDERDELLAWDTKKMFIYTQDDNPQESRFSPVKYELYNYSNYRAEYSIPQWKGES